MPAFMKRYVRDSLSQNNSEFQHMNKILIKNLVVEYNNCLKTREGAQI